MRAREVPKASGLNLPSAMGFGVLASLIVRLLIRCWKGGTEFFEELFATPIIRF
jgi:hypothetical protein